MDKINLSYKKLNSDGFEKPKFMELQNYSVNDGSGIRTNIFLAGCPLDCEWCANPESSRASFNRIAFYKKKCIGCGKCVDVCPTDVAIDINAEGEREKCIECGKCVEVCPTGARSLLIYEYELDDIVKGVQKHSIFYRLSNGGVTFSGGEPTVQIDTLRRLANIFYDKGLNLAIETCGTFDFDRVRDVLELMDLIFIDLKQTDSEIHRKFTGSPNERIIENIRKIGELGIEIVVRIPLIKGVNAYEENIRKSAELVAESFKHPKMELLPYHRFGDMKYEALGIKLPSEEFERPTDEEIKAFEDIIKSYGIEVVSYK